ncbi:MAG: hypothetical protein ACQBVK_02875 [Candidatus Phytoplasma sp. TWB_XP]
MSNGITEIYCGTYSKYRNNQNKKKTNNYQQPKSKCLNLYYPNKTVPTKKKASNNKRIKVIKNY